jgi:hypothetical protein
MTSTPIDSKQISHIDYDNQAELLTVHYCQGISKAFPDIAEEQYHSLLKSTNRYDSLIELTNSQQATHMQS